MFCGRHRLAAKLRRSNSDASAGALAELERIVGQIRTRWPRVAIVLRAASGFARDELMTWCEANQSGQLDHAGRIGKAGDALVRGLLFEAAHVLLSRSGAAAR